MKTIDEQFRDWESTAFGYGYGTGEEHILPALCKFFFLMERERTYWHAEMEAELGPVVAWLLINRLCQENIIEYGTSPRAGWLTPEGVRLKDYILLKTDEELYNICCARPEDVNVCSPDACNCGPDGYKKGRICHNVFWRGHSSEQTQAFPEG